MWWLRSQKLSNFFSENPKAFVKIFYATKCSWTFRLEKFDYFFFTHSRICILLLTTQMNTYCFFSFNRCRYCLCGGNFFFLVFLLSNCLVLGLRVVDRVFKEKGYDLLYDSVVDLSETGEEVEGWYFSLLSERKSRSAWSLNIKKDQYSALSKLVAKMHLQVSASFAVYRTKTLIFLCIGFLWYHQRQSSKTLCY